MVGAPMPFETEISVEWGDCDAAGIVFYPNFFAWFDTAFQRMTRARGFGHRVIRERYGIVGLPIVDANAAFRSPASFDDVLTVSAAVGHWGRSSLKVDYRVMLADRLVAEGYEKRVWVRRRTDGGLEGVAIPQEFRAALSG